jgi:hypothetical protein
MVNKESFSIVGSGHGKKVRFSMSAKGWTDQTRPTSEYSKMARKGGEGGEEGNL